MEPWGPWTLAVESGGGGLKIGPGRVCRPLVVGLPHVDFNEDPDPNFHCIADPDPKFTIG
jgi:hypothetical protein